MQFPPVHHRGNRTQFRPVDLLASLVPVRAGGTVDCLQGQEAQVDFHSLTASEGTGATHELEFLPSVDRMNVVVSRPRGLAVLVCSQALLERPCHSMQKIWPVDALCTFGESAELIGV